MDNKRMIDKGLRALIKQTTLPAITDRESLSHFQRFEIPTESHSISLIPKAFGKE